MAPYKNFWTQISKVDNYVYTDKLVLFIENLFLALGLLYILKFQVSNGIKFLILGLSFLFLSLLSKLTKYRVVNYIMEGNGYRLGDMLKDKKFRYQINGKNFHQKYYPDSIASEYMRKTKDDNNFNILINIVDSRKLPDIPKSNEMIIHMRTGDEVNKDPRNVDEMLASTYKENQYIRPLSYYNSLKIPKNIETVIIVSNVYSGGDTRSTDDFTKSYDYIDRVALYFKNKGFNVVKKLNQDPDYDFLFMAKSKYFVPSYGGYSNLIKNIVTKKNNFIIKK